MDHDEESHQSRHPCRRSWHPRAARYQAMPKGMLPIVDKPAIQYLVEEAVRSGITDILIILGRNQSIIEDHFDRSPELEEKLAAPGKEKMLEECLASRTLPTSSLCARSRRWAWATP